MRPPVIVAVPMSVIHCRAWIDHSRSWSIVDEAVLLALALKKSSDTVAALVLSSGLHHQVVVASLARLMRFRLVEISTSGRSAAFVASTVGSSLALGGNPLPHFPQEVLQRFSFGVEHVTGSCFAAHNARIVSLGHLEDDIRQGADVRFLSAAEADAGGIPEASIARLYELIERGGDRRLLRLATRETVVLRNRYMRLRVAGGAVRNFPEGATERLRHAVLASAGVVAGGDVPVALSHAGEEVRGGHVPVQCHFDPTDIVIGGSAQSALLTSIVEKARSRLGSIRISGVSVPRRPEWPTPNCRSARPGSPHPRDPDAPHQGKFPPADLDWVRLLRLIGPASAAVARSTIFRFSHFWTRQCSRGPAQNRLTIHS